MALPSILHHFDLRLADADRGIEVDVALKVARHPSETMERVWVRLLAYAWKWREGLTFGPGLCEPEAPDLAARGPDGRAILVVRVGRPEPARIERDLSRNPGAAVAVLFDAPRRLEAFLAEAHEKGLRRVAAADLAALDGPLVASLARHDGRRIKASITLVADHVYVDLGGETIDGPIHRRPFHR